MMLPLIYRHVSISYTEGTHIFNVDRSFTSYQQCSLHCRLAHTYGNRIEINPSCVGDYVATSGFRLRILEIGWIP